MHTKRLLIVLPALMMLVPIVPLHMTGLLSLEERERTRESLQDAIGDAAAEYRVRGGLQSSLEKGKTALSAQEIKVRDLERRKVAMRKEVVRLHRIRARIETRTGTDLATLDDAKLLRDAARARLSELLRQRSAGRWLWAARDERLLRFQEELLKDLTAGVSVLARLERTNAEREEVLTAYAKAARTYDETAESVQVSEEQLRENRRIMADVHAQVLSLQGEMARIDEKLRRKAGRALVQKGLIAAEDMLHGSAPTQAFSWPVYGRISAGFKNKAYVQHFGVQHYGADIVVPQSTPVGAASDGVVFLVRDGGRTGYTYILIGHRDGYATLYGHLSETHVQSGQEVSAGETIGLSGGKPGTYGAGPMTTGSHLHFEVILNGANVDPTGVLP